VRRLKNHSSKLQRADGELESDAGIKEPENSRDQSIVNLQETGPLDRGRQPYRMRNARAERWVRPREAARTLGTAQPSDHVCIYTVIYRGKDKRPTIPPAIEPAAYPTKPLAIIELLVTVSAVKETTKQSAKRNSTADHALL
jgi:hypothetical protein